MTRQPSPKVKRAAWDLLAYVKASIVSGMYDLVFLLHDELKHFLDVFDPEAKYQPKRRRG